MKPVRFVGSSLESLRRFPEAVRQDAGYQIDRLQRGKPAMDFNPMSSIGKGVEEIRLWDDTGTFRVIYTVRLAGAVYVLHAFQKKTERTSKHDLALATSRYAQLLSEMK